MPKTRITPMAWTTIALLGGALLLPARPSAAQFGGLSADPERRKEYEEHQRKLDQARHELEVLKARVAIKEAEIKKAEAEFRLRELERSANREAVKFGFIMRNGPDRAQIPDGASQLDPKNRAILAALDKPISMRFAEETPLGEIIKYIRDATKSDALPDGIPIEFDPAGLEDAGKTELTPVRLNLEGVPLKRSLKLVLNQLKLAYIIDDGRLTITSKEKAQRPHPGVEPK